MFNLKKSRPTYAKNLEHIAIRLVTGKLVASTVETEHELLRVWIRPRVVVVLIGMSHDVGP